MSINSKKQEKKKSGRLKKLFIVLALLFSVGMAVWYMIVSSVYDKMTYERADSFATCTVKKGWRLQHFIDWK